jgi:hypothetical protein
VFDRGAIQEHMTRRQITALSLLGLGVILILSCGFLAFFLEMACVRDEGSKVLAAQWSDELGNYSSPEVACAANPDIIALNCKNGEWVFGLCKDSHGYWHSGGGTMVVRDSTGRSRVFFGHICGTQYLSSFTNLQSLQEFYEKLKKEGLNELSIYEFRGLMRVPLIVRREHFRGVETVFL